MNIQCPDTRKLRHIVFPFYFMDCGSQIYTRWQPLFSFEIYRPAIVRAVIIKIYFIQKTAFLRRYVGNNVCKRPQTPGRKRSADCTSVFFDVEDILEVGGWIVCFLVNRFIG